MVKKTLIYIWCKICAVIFRLKIALAHLFNKNSEIAKYKNIHKGKRCFIVATGSSLTMDDLEKLKNEYTFSMNSIITVFKDTTFRPTYYLCQDKIVLDRIREDLKKASLPNVFLGVSNVGSKCAAAISPADIKDFPHAIRYNLNTAKILYLSRYADAFIPEFSFCCEQEVADGTTVTYSAIQLAAYMGFSEIYFVGVDCNYEQKNMYVGNSYSAEIKNAKKVQQSHTAAYKVAAEVLQSKGVSLMNATRGGKLEVLPRINLDEVLKRDV